MIPKLRPFSDLQLGQPRKGLMVPLYIFDLKGKKMAVEERKIFLNSPVCQIKSRQMIFVWPLDSTENVQPNRHPGKEIKDILRTFYECVQKNPHCKQMMKSVIDAIAKRDFHDFEEMNDVCLLFNRAVTTNFTRMLYMAINLYSDLTEDFLSEHVINWSLSHSFPALDETYTRRYFDVAGGVREILSSFQPKNKRKIAHIGCGYGLVILGLASKCYSRPAQFTGVELDSKVSLLKLQELRDQYNKRMQWFGKKKNTMGFITCQSFLDNSVLQVIEQADVVVLDPREYSDDMKEKADSTDASQSSLAGSFSDMGEQSDSPTVSQKKRGQSHRVQVEDHSYVSKKRRKMSSDDTQESSTLTTSSAFPQIGPILFSPTHQNLAPEPQDLPVNIFDDSGEQIEESGQIAMFALPQPSVSQPIDLTRILPTKCHSSTSSTVTNKEEGGQSVASRLHNVVASQAELFPSESIAKVLAKHNGSSSLQAKHDGSTSSTITNDMEEGHSVETSDNVLTEISELQVKVLEAEVQVLKKNNSTCQTRIEALETMCQQYKAQVQQKMLEAERAIEQKEIVMKGNQTLLTKCDQLNLSLKEKEHSEAQQVQKHQNEVRRVKAELEKKDKEMRKRDETLLAKCEQLKSFLKNEKELEVQKLQNEVVELNTVLDKKDKDLGALTIQNSKLCSSSETLSNENLEIRSVMTRLEATVAELQTRNKSLETMCQQYKTQVQQQMLEADRATEQKEIVMKGNETLMAQCERLNSSLKEKEESEAQQLQNHKKEVKKLKADLDKKNKEMNKGNEMLLAQCEELKSILKEKEKSEARQLQNHKNEVEKLNFKLEKRDKALENSMQEVTDSNRKVVALETSKEVVMKENETLLAKCGQLNSSVKDKARQLQSHQNEVKQLNVELEKRDKALENSMQEVTDSNRKVVALETSKEVVMKENETLLTKCEQLNSTLKEKEDSKIQQVQNHQNEVEKLNANWLRKDKELENCMQEVVALETVKVRLESEVESLKKRTSKQRKAAKILQKNVSELPIIIKNLLPKVVENKKTKTTKKKIAKPAAAKATRQSRSRKVKSMTPAPTLEEAEHVEEHQKSAVIQKVEEFKRKWKKGSRRGCEEQNHDIASIYETCTKMGMNFHEIAKIKHQLAKFLGIQNDNIRLDMRLKLHKKKKTVDSLTSSTSNTDLPFVLGPTNSLVASAQTSPQESSTGAAEYYPPMNSLTVDFKREETFQTNADDQQMPNFDENPRSTSLDDIAAFEIKDEF